MRIYISEDTNAIVTDPNFLAPVTNLSFKRGDSAKIEIVFVEGNSPTTPDADRLIVFGIKESGHYDGSFLVTSDEFTISGNSYVLNPSFNTESLNDALNSGDSDDSNDVASLTAMLEVTWSDDDGDSWQSTGTIVATINNDVIKGIEGTVFESLTPVQWLESYRPSPLILTSDPVNGVGTELVIDGSLTYNGSTPVTFPNMLRYGIANGKPAYSPGGISQGNNQFIGWSSTTSRWYLAQFSPTASWSSPENVATPDLVTGWTPTGLATGTPTVELWDYETSGTVPSGLGQEAYVNESGVYKCVRVSPAKWMKLN